MTPCIEHTGCLNWGGYGVLRHKGKTLLAHRVAYCLANNLEISEIKGLVVRHKCDNRRCINPSHLLIGTQADNVRDMLERGRQNYTPFLHPSGTNNPMSTVNYEIAEAIRADHKTGMTQRALAKKYAVSQPLINEVVNNKRWSGLACQVSSRIAPLSITADGLAQLGFTHAATDKAAKLFLESQFPRICDALITAIGKAKYAQHVAA